MATLKKLLNLITKKKKLKKRILRNKPVLTLYEPLVRSIEENFSSKIKLVDDCWEWQGKLDRYGYGKLRVGSNTVKAHRYSYEIYNGSFDKNLHVLHYCDNTKCVNPKHLFLGTNRDNVIDKINKGRQKFTSHKLTEVEREQIFRSLREATPKKQIAENFGVCVQTIKRLSKEL